MTCDSIKIDATGLLCPMPVLKLQKSIRGLVPGTRITLMATDPMSYLDVRHYCETCGHELLSVKEEDNQFTYELKVGDKLDLSTETCDEIL
ncbi:MAG: sulfurtransferase TusA family protein [Pseudomonadota bacterium]|nr:sulfurtransferase TusA family protein [Pseudomonadota bacterium]